MKLETGSYISKFQNLRQSTKETLKKFTITEKVIFALFSLVLVASLLSILIKINSNFLVEIPQRGGTIKEGLIGSPRFINPTIAISETDRDLTSLIYSGLVKIDSKGEVQNDLAESVSISEDGLEYTVKIKDKAVFHDGKKVTTDDVIFTISKTQDPIIKSPKRPNWGDIKIEKINDKEIKFTLTQPYSPFIYNLTLGILPKHIWEKISADEFAFSKFNLEPIGSGPYKIDSIKKDSDDIIKRYTLQSFKKYTLGQPYIDEIQFLFYKNENDLITALNKNDIHSAHGIEPQNINQIYLKNKNIIKIPFSRIFALFINQNKNDVLADKVVREALNIVAPKKDIVQDVLFGYGHIANSPITIDDTNNSKDKNIEEATNLLIKNGWTKNAEGIFEKNSKSASKKLSFSISTANVDELVNVTELLAKKYKEFGANVDVKIFEPNDLTSNVIRPREFETIFFGQVINRDFDLYGFWHSSQKDDPGLNIAGFTNIDANKALEKIRTTNNLIEKTEALQKFEKEVINDVPAIFLYSPDFIYIVPQNLKRTEPVNIVVSSDRFTDIEKWHINTDKVWKIFSK